MIISKATGKLLVPHTPKLDTLFSEPIKTIEHQNQIYAILPHTPRTQIQLRAAGIEVPASILFHYDWASNDGAIPFQVQKNTASLATSHQRAYVLNDMGTGKTKSTIWSWHYLHQIGMAKKLLVVAPLSTLKFVWMREISMTMGLKAAVLHGSRQQRLKLLASKADVYIINHDGLKSIATELYARKDIDCMIIDELAVYRNNSQRSKRMRDFAGRFTWVWGLTGRPMPNAPTDVFNQCKILTPNANGMPKYFRHAQSALMLQVDKYRWVPRDGAIDKAYQWMQPSVRFSLDDVVELPEAIYRTVDVEMSTEQKMVYRKLANEFAILVREQVITAANAAVAMGKLLQVGAGYLYSKNPLHVVLDSESRKNMLLELINEAPHKVIVFAPWRHLIDGLSKFMSELKEPIDHAVVHGDINRRETIFNAFQNTTQYRVLLAHPQCVHHGITLTAATTTIWYSPICSLEIYEQANARIRRIGQKNKQLFLHLQSSQVERKVYAMLRNKQRTQDAFLEMIKTSTTNGGIEYAEIS
jgi:SNF2 family DNA or RNA helicase